MKRKDGWFDVASNDNRYWLETSYWRSSQDKAMYDIGFFVKEETAIAALNHPDTPQPPGWKAEKPASPGLRAAEDVVSDICRRHHFDNSTEVKRKTDALTAERVAVASHIKTKLLEQFGMPDTRDRICHIMRGVIKELQQ